MSACVFLLLAISAAPEVRTTTTATTASVSAERSAQDPFTLGADAIEDFRAERVDEPAVLDQVRALSPNDRAAFLSGWRSVGGVDDARVTKFTKTLISILGPKPRSKSTPRAARPPPPPREPWGLHDGPVIFRTAVGMGHVSVQDRVAGFTFDAELNIGVAPLPRLLTYAKFQTLLSPEPSGGDSVILLGFGGGAGYYLPADVLIALGLGAANLNSASSTDLGFTADLSVVKEWVVGPTTGAQVYIKGLMGAIPNADALTLSFTAGFGIAVN